MPILATPKSLDDMIQFYGALKPQHVTRVDLNLHTLIELCRNHKNEFFFMGIHLKLDETKSDGTVEFVTAREELMGP